MENFLTKLSRHQLEWVWHVATMTYHCMPHILFVWKVKSNLQSLGIGDSGWCDRDAGREQWQTLFLQCMDHQHDRIQVAQVKSVFCTVFVHYL